DKGYHSVPSPLTGNFIPRKSDLTFIDEIVESENLDVTTVVTRSNVKTIADRGISNTVESNAVRMDNASIPIIKEWNSDDESEINYTTCYVLNRVLVIKPHNKTPYELIRGRPPLIDFMKSFRCPVTILNTRDHLGKFDGKADEGYFVSTTNVKGNGPAWLFDVDSLTISMNYVPVAAGNKTNSIAGTKDNIVAGQAQKEKEPEQEYILIPLCITDPLISQGPKDYEGDAGMKPTETEHTNSSNGINTISAPISTAGLSFDIVVPSTPVNTAGPSVIDLPRDKWAIDTKWVFRNKNDERGIVVKNKARLVTQGHTQEEGIGYDEVFAPVARIEAIRLFLAYASFKDFPPGFEDPYFPDKVYKVEKALYGLHQAPRAWHKDDILLVQVYVDDIIFGSTKKQMSNEFEMRMHDKFQMSSI
ncbi:retrovirus-related pol polyprotein from transposon TNT 1-94, partial [Tanacetum coccineum]